MKNFLHFQDNKTGWLRVSRDVMNDLNLTQNDISLDSKVDINYVYLHQNSDMKWFEQVYKKHYGVTPNIKKKMSQRCSIRNKINNYFIK